MPETRDPMAKNNPENRAGTDLGEAVLRASGAFGSLAPLAAEVLASRGIVLVVGSGWQVGPEAVHRLLAAVEASPSAAFAFGAEGAGPPDRAGESGGTLPVDAEVLVARPRDPGPLAIRVSEAARLGWPDFGPPDLVLDGVATWALATSLAVRGGPGLFVPGARFRRTADDAGVFHSLWPQGLAWLTSCALTWGPGGRPPVHLAERLWRRWTGQLAAAGFDGLAPPEAGAA